MCLAVPGRIVGRHDRDGTAMAEVDFGGVRKEVCLQYLADAAPGDYVIVHVGFAIQRLDEQSALDSLAEYERLGVLADEFGDDARAARQPAGEGSAP
jgi:hydrogenase expression/formation protein HypC